MSQLSEKERSLMVAIVKNFNGNIHTFVNWNQTALDSNYKDAKNAKAMWKRLAKKLADAPAAAPGAPPAAAARAAEGDKDNAGDGTTKTSVTAGKKRKAAGTPEGDSSPTEAVRPTKMPKGSKDQSNAANKADAMDVKTKGHSSDPDTEQQGEGEAAETSIA